MQAVCQFYYVGCRPRKCWLSGFFNGDDGYVANPVDEPPLCIGARAVHCSGAFSAGLHGSKKTAAKDECPSVKRCAAHGMLRCVGADHARASHAWRAPTGERWVMRAADQVRVTNVAVTRFAIRR